MNTPFEMESGGVAKIITAVCVAGAMLFTAPAKANISSNGQRVEMNADNACEMLSPGERRAADLVIPACVVAKLAAAKAPTDHAIGALADHAMSALIEFSYHALGLDVEGLPPLSAAFHDDGSLFVEWDIDANRRLGFRFLSDARASTWFIVTSTRIGGRRLLGNLTAGGPERAEIETLLHGRTRAKRV